MRERTGLVLDPYFSGSKIEWLLTEGGVAADDDLAVGTIDAWLMWKLTNGAVHATEPSNASRTMLFDIRTLSWSDELCSLFGVPMTSLPEVRPSSGRFGVVAGGLDGLDGVPIAGVAGDQQAALFGQRCTRPGMVKNTYGTGCFMLMHTGSEPMRSQNRLITTAACSTGGDADYALEGSVFIAGAAVQWLRDGLEIIASSAEVEPLARMVADNGGVYLVPAFAGLGAPHWDQYARGTIRGLTRGTNAGHLARAALEGIAFQVADVLEVMKEDSGVAMNELRVDGGACAYDLLMQFQSDILQVPVVRPKVIETTALGAAYLAGLAVSFWKDRAEVQRGWQADRVFSPRMSADVAAHRRTRWKEALSRARDWEEHSSMKGTA